MPSTHVSLRYHIVFSTWIHKETRRTALRWQEGYGAYTVSPSRIDAVRRYIESQAEHHRVKTFQEEYVEWLREAGIEYDERFLW